MHINYARGETREFVYRRSQRWNRYGGSWYTYWKWLVRRKHRAKTKQRIRDYGYGDDEQILIPHRNDCDDLWAWD